MRAVALSLCAVIAGCAQTSVAPPLAAVASTPAAVTSNPVENAPAARSPRLLAQQRAVDPVESAERKVDASIASMGEMARGPLRLFLQDPKAACSGEQARKARGFAQGSVEAIRPSKFPIRAVVQMGIVYLDVADGMRKRACPQARAMYEFALAYYVGGAYSGLRDRARHGLAELRGR